jgi:hypothetical protein
LYLFYEFSFPPGWKVDNENEYYLIYKAENIEEENINKLKSISQVSTAFVETFDDEYMNSKFDSNISKPDKENFLTSSSKYTVDSNQESNSLTHNFGMPYELELLCHDYVLGKFNPKLLIQINSVDSYNRHRIEGYCFINIPLETGSYKFEIPCYKPKEDNYMKLFSFFLGGSRKIPDLREIAKTCSKNENVIIYNLKIIKYNRM